VGKKICCLLCLDAGSNDPTFTFNKNDTSNQKRHILASHADEWAQLTGSSAPSGRPSVASTAPTERALFQPGIGSNPDSGFRGKVWQTFNLEALQKLIAAALLLQKKSNYILSTLPLRFALGAIGGICTDPGALSLDSGKLVFRPPDYRTAVKFERAWEAGVRANIKAVWIKEKILGPDGRPLRSCAPRMSLSFDGSSTKVDGYSSFSLNVNWLSEADCIPQHFSIGVTKFLVADNPTETQLQQTAENLCLWVIKELKDVGLLPADLVGFNLQRFFRGATTDNASPERSAVVMFDVQQRAGVAAPLSLISRSATRWHNSVEMLWRAVLLREHLPHMFVTTRRAIWEDDWWAHICQSLVFLSAFRDAIIACQSRTLLIGDHLIHIVRLFDVVFRYRHRHMLRQDFSPGPDFLNVAVNRNLHAVLDQPDFTVDARPEYILPETFKLLERLQEQLQLRTGRSVATSKRQLNPTASLNALVFSPSMKSLAVGVPVIQHGHATFQFVQNDLYTKQVRLCAPPPGARRALTSSRARSRLQEQDNCIATIMAMGKDLEKEMNSAAAEAVAADATERSPPRKTPRTEMVALLNNLAVTSAAATQPSSALLSAVRPDHSSAFAIEFNSYRALPATDESMSEFWNKDATRAKYPILRRLFLSICSTRPDNAEPERSFSAMSILLAPVRKSMSAETVRRKMFLYLNASYWHPCPSIKGTAQYKKLLQLLKLKEWNVPLTEESSDSGSESDNSDDDIVI
jgi:hypothetical protein